MNLPRAKYLLTAVVFCFGLLSVCNSQTLSIIPNNTTFNINTSSQLETSSTITSSFALNVTSSNKNASYSLYAGVTSKSFNPQTTTFASIPLKVSLRSVTGVSNASAATSGQISLVEYPPTFSTLASNISNSTKGVTAVYTYDLILSPIGYTIPPGSYIFTVTVQYSDGTKTISPTFDITLNVQNITSLNLVSNTAPNFAFSTPSQFTSSVTIDNASTFTVKSNKPWIFTAASTTANFSNTGTYSTTMPASILKLRVNTNEITLSTIQQQLNTGASTSGLSFGMSYNANVGYTYGPGNYTIAITYTLTAQ